MVRGIGGMLRFQREGSELAVSPASSGDRTVEPTCGIDLHAGLRRITIQRAAAGGIHGVHGQLRNRLIAGLVQDPILVVPAGNGELIVAIVDVGADRGRVAEVERRPCDGGGRAERDLASVDWQELVRVDREHLLQHSAWRPGAGQIEVGLLRMSLAVPSAMQPPWSSTVMRSEIPIASLWHCDADAFAACFH